MRTEVTICNLCETDITNALYYHQVKGKEKDLDLCKTCTDRLLRIFNLLDIKYRQSYSDKVQVLTEIVKMEGND